MFDKELIKMLSVSVETIYHFLKYQYEKIRKCVANLNDEIKISIFLKIIIWRLGFQWVDTEYFTK